MPVLRLVALVIVGVTLVAEVRAVDPASRNYMAASAGGATYGTSPTSAIAPDAISTYSAGYAPRRYAAYYGAVAGCNLPTAYTAFSTYQPRYYAVPYFASGYYGNYGSMYGLGNFGVYPYGVNYGGAYMFSTPNAFGYYPNYRWGATGAWYGAPLPVWGSVPGYYGYPGSFYW
jgi:hypothetical protein